MTTDSQGNSQGDNVLVLSKADELMVCIGLIGTFLLLDGYIMIVLSSEQVKPL